MCDYRIESHWHAGSCLRCLRSLRHQCVSDGFHAGLILLDDLLVCRRKVPLGRVGRDPEKGGYAEEEACNDAIERESLHNGVGEDVVIALLDSVRVVRTVVLARLRTHRVKCFAYVAHANSSTDVVFLSRKSGFAVVSCERYSFISKTDRRHW